MAIATEVVTSVSLSGLTNYEGEPFDDAATPGELIHTASSTSGVIDEVWAWVCNIDASSTEMTFTVEYAASVLAASDAILEHKVSPQSGLFLVCPGLSIQNGAVLRGLVVAASDFTLFGYVNRITS